MLVCASAGLYWIQSELLKGVSNEGLLITGAPQDADGLLLELVEEDGTPLVDEAQSVLDREAEFELLEEVETALVDDTESVLLEVDEEVEDGELDE